MAGRGHFYFIDQMSEIDKKVLDALQREAYEYLIIKSIQFFNLQGEAADYVNVPKNPSLAHGTAFNFMTLVDPARERIASVSVKIEDPNNGTEKVTAVNLLEYQQGEALFKLAAKTLLDQERAS